MRDKETEEAPQGLIVAGVGIGEAESWEATDGGGVEECATAIVTGRFAMITSYFTD